MDNMFMNSKNSKTSDPNRLLPNLSQKINVNRSDNMLLYQILAYTTYMEKHKKDIQK